MEAGEGIAACAVREVLEETGVACEFVQLYSLVETHDLPLPVYQGFSSLLGCCLLRTTEPRPVPRIQEQEIEAAAWLSIEDLRGEPVFQRGIMRELLDTGHRAAIGGCRGMASRTIPLDWRPGTAELYRPVDP